MADYDTEGDSSGGCSCLNPGCLHRLAARPEIAVANTLKQPLTDSCWSQKLAVVSQGYIPPLLIYPVFTTNMC